MNATYKVPSSGSTFKKKRNAVDIAYKNSYAHKHTSDMHIIQLKPICPCDGGCPRCAETIQTKLVIRERDDKYEQEADRVADQVMRMPEPALQPKPT